MNCKARSQDRKILGDPLVSLLFGDLLSPLSTKVVGCFGHREQEIEHGLSPRLLFLLCHKKTVPQEVGSTDTVKTAILIVTDPAVVHGSTSKTWPDPNLFQGYLPSFAVPSVQGQ